MKRLVILCFMLFIPFVNSYAQEYKFETRIGWFPVDVYTLLSLIGEDALGETTYGPMKNVGIFAADFDYKVKRWFAVGAKVNYRNSWRDMKTISNGLEVKDIDRMQYFSVMPTVKFTTNYDSVFRWYATLGVGAGIDLSHPGESDRGFLALQFVPVGISVGKMISWYLEFGIGSAYTGFMTGISCRF